MDIIKELRTASGNGTLLYGQRQTENGCADGDVSLVLVAANCPESYVDHLKASHPDVIIHQVGIVNRDLGLACGKPFAVSTVGIIDPGISDLLQLEANI